MTTSQPTSPLPSVIEQDGASVRISRCWPSVRVEDGLRVLRFEGRDHDGALRAGQLHVDAGPEGTWRIGKIRLAKPGVDRKLPDLEAASAHGDLMVHRYGRRAVVRLEDRFAKVVRPGGGPALAEATEGGRRVAHAAGLDAPGVLATDEGRVDLSILPGRSLHDAGSDDTVSAELWATWWDTWAQAWPQVVRGNATAGAQRNTLTVHGPEQERDNLQRWVQHVLDTDILGSRVQQLLPLVEAAYQALLTDAGPVDGAAHRDLHDKQILGTAEGALGILDFDTLSLAEPALDLANLAVHVHLRGAQGLWSMARQEAALARVAQVTAELGVRPERMAAYEEATRLRLICLYSFRPQWYPLAVQMLDGAPLI